MKIFTSSTPRTAAAKELSDALQDHKNSNVLLLLAGGSALQVLDEVDTTYINEYTTIMMMDERFSYKPEENNFLQMTQTFFYTKLSNSQCRFIPSVPTQTESHEDFSRRIETDLLHYIHANPDATILALFGIGPDGHTGGIFPMSQTDFVDTYGQGNLYTKVVYNKNPFPNRSSITPKCIKNYINKSFVYAVGEAKLPILRTMTDPYELYELPAHIHKQIDSQIFTDMHLS